jgi:hypothetical protein
VLQSSKSKTAQCIWLKTKEDGKGRRIPKAVCKKPYGQFEKRAKAEKSTSPPNTGKL